MWSPQLFLLPSSFFVLLFQERSMKKAFVFLSFLPSLFLLTSDSVVMTKTIRCLSQRMGKIKFFHLCVYFWLLILLQTFKMGGYFLVGASGRGVCRSEKCGPRIRGLAHPRCICAADGTFFKFLLSFFFCFQLFHDWILEFAYFETQPFVFLLFSRFQKFAYMGFWGYRTSG